jgi:hypothetical protein
MRGSRCNGAGLFDIAGAGDHARTRFLEFFAANIRKAPLFPTIGTRTGELTRAPLHQANAHTMIRRRAAAAGIATLLGNHSFRATGITAYLKNGGTLRVTRSPRRRGRGAIVEP